MDWNGRFLKIVVLCALQWLVAASIQAASVSATFTPAVTSASYADRLISLIDSAQSQIDISLYGLDDGYVFDALKRAAARGVESGWS